MSGNTNIEFKQTCVFSQGKDGEVYLKIGKFRTLLSYEELTNSCVPYYDMDGFNAELFESFYKIEFFTGYCSKETLEGKRCRKLCTKSRCGW